MFKIDNLIHVFSQLDCQMPNAYAMYFSCEQNRSGRCPTTYFILSIDCTPNETIRDFKRKEWKRKQEYKDNSTKMSKRNGLI